MFARLTGFGRTLFFVFVVGTFGVFAAPRPAHATFGEDAAAVITFLQTIFLSLLNTLLTNAMNEILVGKGDAAIVEQEAAGTVALQNALQEHAAVQVEALTRQTTEMVKDRVRHAFGNFGTVNVGPYAVSVGSTAPSACRAYAEAPLVAQGSATANRTMGEGEGALRNFNSNFKSTTQALGAMQDSVTRYGRQALATDWKVADVVGDGAPYDAALNSIKFSSYADPLPQPDARKAGSAATAEYTLRLRQHEEAVKTLEMVQLRQLAQVRQIPGKPGTSRQSALMDSAKASIENSQQALALQGTTAEGLQREIAIGQNTLLAIEAERMKNDKDVITLLTIIAGDSLKRDRDNLRQEAARTVSAD